MMDDPNFLQQMNEAMDNPAVIEMMQNSPMVRQNPMVAEMLRNPELRRAMFNPEMMRMQLQMQRAMNQSGGGSNFPMPGATNTTPQNQAGDQTQSSGAAPNAAAANPFASLMGGGLGSAGAGANNPFAALLGGGANPWGPPQQNQTSTPSTGTDANATATAGSTENTQGAQNTSSTSPPPPNPSTSLFGAPPAGAGGAQQPNPIAEMSRQMMQNPEMMRAAMQMMGGAGGSPFGQPPSNTSDGSNPAAANPFAALFGPGGGFGGAGGFGATPAPQDNRPPEEVYENQLRQLNEMGFYEFERNVTALRRSGGNVQAAIEFLLVSCPHIPSIEHSWY